MRLAGRTALVTGGSRGIGKAIVRALAAEGAKVAFTYNSNTDAANELVKELELDQREAYAIQANAADAEKARELIESLLEKWEKIDILVNNAGIIKDGLLATMSEENWSTVINTNLTSVYNYCQAAMRPMMSARHGRIINISSVAGRYGNPGQTNYAATKGGIDGFTRCLAHEVGRRGITVNSIAPGFINTDMTEAVRNAAGKEITKQISVRRLGEPEDIANAVVFFSLNESSYVTGQVLTVDGGLTLGSGM
ncbi:MAG: 3-oxoacyl-[acyl-carrier-protein] reductase [Planctomycetota bacterium]|nr:3-oxoacyl-[acyl-carrier-protein] reductase [Planctomycetota bacterium]MDA1251521.1 3-oxoacyl-[acyl-carrier-protein] reductase [Planctomycetota bacterium]